jgi:hypothetical protein
MTRILAFAGKKQSGKNTCCNFLHGYQMKSHGLLDNFAISDKGQLIVSTDGSNQGLLDVTREDIEFAVWAVDNMWPFIKHYAFASPLKEIATGLFGLSKEQCHGSNAEKNSLTWIRWEDIPGYKGDETGRMTAREFLQVFGTEICRGIYADIWTERTIKNISNEEPLIAVISDCRFPNEVEAVQRAGGKVIHLTRSNLKDTHNSEVALDGFEGYDSIIDNQDLSVLETNKRVLELMNEWGWLGETVQEEAPVEPIDSEESSFEGLVGGITAIKQKGE